MPPRKIKNSKAEAKSYRHPTATSPLRPDVGTQAQFKKKKAPQTYRYDSSLSPALDWDGQNSAREQGEALLGELLDAKSLDQAKAAAQKLKALGRAFLNWAGKAERLSFDVPTLPLFVHERLSTKAIIETLRGHKRDHTEQMALFADPQHPITDQVLRAYEHQDEWVNRMTLGDSLVVMNSLLHYENLAGQVQMVYMDPPYAVSFGSNFQPFVRKRDVIHNDDADMTREPETVQAYRDTWELGTHSYLTYLRDRFLLARDLLAPSGSIFVQINDEHVRYVADVLAEVFGAENLVVTIPVKKKGSQKSKLLDPVNDYLVWFAKDIARARDSYTQLFEPMQLNSELAKIFRYVELADGREISLGDLRREDGEPVDYTKDPSRVPSDFSGARIFTSENATSGGFRKNQSVLFKFKDRDFDPGIKRGNCWKHTATKDDGSPSGMDKLAAAGRLFVGRDQLRIKRFLDDFGYTALSNWWDGLGGASDPLYVVQTNDEIVKRCILMTTRPGDLVFDPTCGSGTTAYVAEQWGRRWITADVSRVPLALARQRLLTATFPWYELTDTARGPAGGFRYVRRQDRKGREAGGLVPHITSSTVANDEPPKEEVLVDRPEAETGVTRVSGPFVVEATIATPVDWEGDGQEDSGAGAEDYAAFTERMLEVLRQSPVLRLQGNRTVTLKNIRPPAKTLSLSAEALVENGTEKPVAFVFGPENGAVSQNLVFQAAKEAAAKNYSHLYVIGFAIQPTARELVENSASVVGVPATYVEATRDLHMGDLLKNMRSSQIFSVCGLPEVKIHRAKDGKFQVELLGLDVLDPVTMELDHRDGDDVPAWLLDTDYNDLCFHVTQAFFPRTSAWENLKKALRTDYAEGVWDHLAGTKSAPFEAGDHGQVAVKVIDDRGNELLVVKKLSEAKR